MSDPPSSTISIDSGHCSGSKFKPGELNASFVFPSLDRFHLALNRRGEIVVDKSVVFRSADEWSQRGAYIDV